MMSAGDLTISPGAGEVLGATAGAVDLARSVMVTTRQNLHFDILPGGDFAHVDGAGLGGFYPCQLKSAK
jgi:hypothetical protein